MDNTTPQPNNQPLDPNALSATLAHATNLQESMMPQAQPQEEAQTAPQEPQNGLGQEQPQETTQEPSKGKESKSKDLAAKINKMETDIEIIKKAILSDVQEDATETKT